MDGGWSGWSGWSGCAPGICAGNQRIRTRTCTSPIPSEDGKYCDTGDSSQQQDCMSEYKIDEYYELYEIFYVFSLWICMAEIIQMPRNPLSSVKRSVLTEANPDGCNVVRRTLRISDLNFYPIINKRKGCYDFPVYQRLPRHMTPLWCDLLLSNVSDNTTGSLNFRLGKINVVHATTTTTTTTKQQKRRNKIQVLIISRQLKFCMSILFTHLHSHSI